MIFYTKCHKLRGSYLNSADEDAEEAEEDEELDAKSVSRLWLLPLEASFSSSEAKHATNK